MWERIKVAWAVLRGRSVMSGIHIRGGTIVCDMRDIVISSGGRRASRRV